MGVPQTPVTAAAARLLHSRVLKQPKRHTHSHTHTHPHSHTHTHTNNLDLLVDPLQLNLLHPLLLLDLLHHLQPLSPLVLLLGQLCCMRQLLRVRPKQLFHPQHHLIYAAGSWQDEVPFFQIKTPAFFREQSLRRHVRPHGRRKLGVCQFDASKLWVGWVLTNFGSNLLQEQQGQSA